MSALLAATIWGRSASSGLYCRSSSLMASKSATGSRPFTAGHVHHMYQQPAAVHVAQEVVAQAGALAGALNDAGDVGHDEADALIHPHHAQVGEQGGEVVVGDLGLGLGHHGQAAWICPHWGSPPGPRPPGASAPGSRHGSRRGVLPWQSGAPAGWGWRSGMLPQPPRPPLQRTKGSLASSCPCMISPVSASRTRVPRGTLDDRGPAPSLPDFRAPWPSAPLRSHVLALVAEVHQGGHIVIHLQNDGAAPAAVAAVRPAGSHVFFSVKGHRHRCRRSLPGQ